MSDEQELSVDEILASIRRILSAELDEKPEKISTETLKPIEQEKRTPPCPQNVFVLSDAMRVPEKALFSTSQLNTTHVPQQAVKHHPQEGEQTASLNAMTTELVKQWLDTHLPAVVEEIVVKEVRALLRRP